MSSAPSNSRSPFLPTSQVFPEEESQRLIVLTDNYISVALAVNQREIGTYETIEQLNGQQFFNTTSPEKKRFGYRTVFTFGAILAGATLSFAHSLSITEMTDYWANVLTAADFRTVPYASATLVTDQIQMTVTPTLIVIINGATAPNITSGTAILEYLKN